MRAEPSNHTFSGSHQGVALGSSVCVFGLAFGLFLTGCSEWPFLDSGADLRKFGSELDFKQYLAGCVTAERSRSMWNLPFLSPIAFDVDMGAETGAPDDAGPQYPGSEGAADYSGTNIQEEGVHESDVVKNDGAYIYILTDSALQIVQAFPADEMSLVSTTELPGSAGEIYLREDTIVAVGSGWDHENDTTTTTVTTVDVSDRSAPSIRATVTAEASLVTSRLIGSKLHLVVQLHPELPEWTGPLPLALIDADRLIPDITVAPTGGRTRSRDLVQWNDIYHPLDPDGYQLTAVVTVDVDEPDDPAQSVGVMANAGTVYVAPTALYITDTDYNYNDELRETTQVYRFDLQGDGAVFVGAGQIPGRILNRFSLGEYDGHLRTATTIGHVWRWGDGGAKNNVYVLHPEGGRLVITGQVENIAPGERIYSARFIGERGFMVTFKKVDPLFTLDLSDPTAPKVVGELKVPGYSDYIHPLGENHLLTIGKDAVDMGDFAWYQGVQLSVFDVSDFAEPTRVDVEIVGVRGTESEALHNSHAFTYFPPAETLAVPMDIYEGVDLEPSRRGQHTFTGLCLYHVTADEGIEPLGRIATAMAGEPYAEEWDRYGRPPWTRGIFIGDFVYAVTNIEISALPLADLSASPFHLPLE